jgi:hypothetical protein
LYRQSPHVQAAPGPLPGKAGGPAETKKQIRQRRKMTLSKVADGAEIRLFIAVTAMKSKRSSQQRAIRRGE